MQDFYTETNITLAKLTMLDTITFPPYDVSIIFGSTESNLSWVWHKLIDALLYNGREFSLKQTGKMLHILL